MNGGAARRRASFDRPFAHSAAPSTPDSDSESVLEAQIEEHPPRAFRWTNADRERDPGDDLEAAREVDRGAHARGDPRRLLGDAGVMRRRELPRAPRRPRASGSPRVSRARSRSRLR